jgi:ankyrin repeat protein
MASQNGHKEIAQTLLHDKNIEINQQDYRGNTALMYASQNGHEDIVQMLLQNENREINNNLLFLCSFVTSIFCDIRFVVELKCRDEHLPQNHQIQSWKNFNNVRKIKFI